MRFSILSRKLNAAQSVFRLCIFCSVEANDFGGSYILLMHNTMFLPLLVLFLDTFDTARATLTFTQARQTTIQDDVSGLQSGWTPKPTSPPTFLPWLGAASRGQLYTRQEVNPEICGWLSGDPDKPLECGTAEVCAFYNSYETKGYVCCPTTASGSIEAGSCPYRSSCMNFGQVGNEHWGTGEFVGTDAVLSW